jgi:4-amino-4-deoxy-L-arabinose transferase-like glycosyltransferase
VRYHSIARVAAAGLLAVFLLGQGISAPFTKDAEPQSAQWIADIVNHGHWLIPADYYGFVDPKPPLYYWLSALVAGASGGFVDETRARAVSTVAGAGLAVIVLEWTTASLGTATGWLAFLFLIGSYGFASRATTALTDMLMSLLVFAVYCMIFPALDAGQTWGRTVAAGVLLGLAILTKGPVVVVILGLAVLIYTGMIRRNPLALMRFGWPWVTLLIAVAIAAAWYVPAFAAGRHDDLAAIFVSENFGHFLPSSMGGTGEAARPFYYVALRLLGGMMPLSLLIPALALAFAQGEFVPGARRPILFQLAMALAVLLLFSAASAKRDDYILPAIPPLAILFAALFTRLHIDGKPRTIAATGLRDLTTAAIATLMVAGTILALIVGSMRASGGALSIQLRSSDAANAAIFVDGISHYRWPFVVFVAAVMIGAAAVLAGVWQRRGMLSGGGLALLALAGSLLWTGVVRPAAARTRSLVAFAPAVRARVGDAPVYVAYFDPEFSWYYGRGMPLLPSAIARAGAPSPGPVYLVARPPGLMRLAPAVRGRLQMIMRANLSGGGGPPSLYQIPLLAPPADLNTPLQATK